MNFIKGNKGKLGRPINITHLGYHFGRKLFSELYSVLW